MNEISALIKWLPENYIAPSTMCQSSGKVLEEGTGSIQEQEDQEVKVIL